MSSLDRTLVGAFVTCPTRENYARVFQAVVRLPDYQPYVNDEEVLVQLLESRKKVELGDAVEAMTARNFLSPRFHIFASYIFRKLDDQPCVELELFTADRCVEGILASGDGSFRRPYLVTHPRDERDIVSRAGLEGHGRWAPNPNHVVRATESQRLEQHGARWLDVVKTAAGREVWFDVTAAVDALQTALAASA